MVGNTRKIAVAVEECLSLMDASDAPLVIETDFVSKLQGNSTWSDQEVRQVQRWVSVARDRAGDWDARA